MALDAARSGLVASDPERPTVSGVVVDIPDAGGAATVAALADGTTSMYTSTGGGVIGAGEHPAVAEATAALIHTADDLAAQFLGPAEEGVPEQGVVRFHLLTPMGRRHVDVPAEAFWGEQPHRLMPLIAATQHVISELRRTSPE